MKAEPRTLNPDSEFQPASTDRLPREAPPDAQVKRPGQAKKPLSPRRASLEGGPSLDPADRALSPAPVPDLQSVPNT